MLALTQYYVRAQEYTRKCKDNPDFAKEVEYWYEKLTEAVRIGILEVQEEAANPTEFPPSVQPHKCIVLHWPSFLQLTND